MIPEPSRKTFVIKSSTPEASQAEHPQHPKEAVSTPRRHHFEIKSRPPKFELPNRDHHSPTVSEGLAADVSSNSNRQFRLYLTDRSFQQIEARIGWGRRTADNGVEQGGILLGDAFRDPEQNLVYVVVCDAIAGRKARGSGAYLDMTHETWAEMLSQVDTIIDAAPNSALQIVGWYHTHPNGLDVFMSGTDQNTQRTFFPHEWQFAVVLNPHKKLWRVYHGESSEQCAGFVTDDKGMQSNISMALLPGAGPDVAAAKEPQHMGEESRVTVDRGIDIGGREELPRPAYRTTATVLALYSLAVTALAVWLWYEGRRDNANELALGERAVFASKLPPRTPEIRNVEELRAIFAKWRAEALKRDEIEERILQEAEQAVLNLSSAPKASVAPPPPKVERGRTPIEDTSVPSAAKRGVPEPKGGEAGHEPTKAAPEASID